MKKQHTLSLSLRELYIIKDALVSHDRVLNKRASQSMDPAVRHDRRKLSDLEYLLDGMIHAELVKSARG